MVGWFQGVGYRESRKRGHLQALQGREGVGFVRMVVQTPPLYEAAHAWLPHDMTDKMQINGGFPRTCWMRRPFE